MRTIKFRGIVDYVPKGFEDRGIKVGDWAYGNYYKAQDEVSIAVDFGDYYDGHFCVEYDVIPETVGMFTGLLDKNGKEIYEGDIVKGVSSAKYGEPFEYCGKVVWYEQSELIGYYVEDENGGAWELEQIAARISHDNITGNIIGNIHERSEV